MPADLVELADERHERVGVCGACAPDFSIAGAMPPSGASAALRLGRTGSSAAA